MFSRVDRGGSREGKKSLRKNKINMVEKIKKGDGEKKDSGPTKSEQAPALGQNSGAPAMIDAGCNLISRRFDNDFGKVLNRAVTGNIDAMVTMSNDSDKQEAVVELTKQNLGVIYSVVGIHPDGVKRANEKIFAAKADQIKELGLLPQTVALLCGLDYNRDFATRYPQEQLVQKLMELAVEIELPMVLFVSGDEAMAKMVELLNAQAATGAPIRAVALYNFIGTKEEIDTLSQVNEATAVYFMISGVICDPSHDRGQALRGLLKKIPQNRLILGSDAPKFTPQTIEDEYLKSQKNEPSNLSYVLTTLAESLEADKEALAAALRANAKEFYRLYDKGEVVAQPKEDGEESGEEEEEDDGSEGEDGEEPAEAQPASAPAKKVEAKEVKESPAAASKPAPAAAKGKPEPANAKAPAAKGKNAAAVETAPVPANPKQQQKQPVPAAQPAPATGGPCPLSRPQRSKPDRSFREIEASTVKYACMMCRAVLITAKDTIPHEQGLDLLKDSKRARDDVEFNETNVVFAHQVEWMKQFVTQQSTGSKSAGLVTDGKLDCPHCGSKNIGRWHSSSSAEEAFVFTLKRKRVDTIAEGSAAKQRQIEEEQYSDDEEEGGGRNKSKRANKRKKVTKASNLSNMGNFRNKNFGAGGGSRSEKKKQQQQDDDNDE